MEWLAQSADTVSKSIASLPEAFQTTRFWGEVKHIENPLLALKPIFHSLHTKTFSLFEAMDHVGLNFAWDKDRLLKWKRGLTNLRGLALWLPAFSRAREYLRAAFPIDRGRLDHTRESLLQSMDDPLRFLEGKARNEFDERFSEFKKRYMDSYFLLHEDALHIMDSLKKDEVRINPVLLRNLDLLSGLQYSDKSCLNRVKLLAKWIQRNQCNLPLRQILEHYPRCYCNFNPCGNQQPATSAEQINAIIQEGIEYFRTLLRRCGYLILEDLKSLQIDDNSLKQITVALSDGPMIPLNPQSIKILNWIIGKHTDEFLAEVRKLGKRNRSIQ